MSTPLKIVLCGDCVGKTAFCRRVVFGTFVTDAMSTLGFDLVRKTFVYDRHALLTNIIDCSGVEDFTRINQVIFRNTDVVLLFFNTARGLFERTLLPFYNRVKQFAPDVPIVVVGTHADLPPDDLLVAQVRQWAASLHLPVMHCSSFTGEGVFEVVECALGLLPEVRPAGPPEEERAACVTVVEKRNCSIV